MKLRSRQSGQRGSTLIEVLVAMVIVATVLTALASMMAMSMRVSENNEMEQLAQLKAQEAMEYLRKERLVRGWGTFYTSLGERTYCLNELPTDITSFSTLAVTCAGTVTTLNNFVYKIEVTVDQPNQTTVDLTVNIYRYTKAGTEINGGAPFYTIHQELQQY